MVGLQPGNEPDTSRILGTRVASVTFTNPIPLSAGGRGLRHTIFRLYYGASLLRERMSHITQVDPSLQYNILSRGVQEVHQLWECRWKRKKSLWTDGISQLTGKYNGPRKDTNFIWIFHNSRSSATIKQDTTACRVNIFLKNESSTVCNGKAITAQAWAGPKGPKRFRLPSFKKIGTWRW
jgi:hypothetical protein